MSKLSRLFLQGGYIVDREISVSPISLRAWIRDGNRRFIIDFTTGRSLLISAADSPGWKEALADARKICTEFMGAEPICSYDTKPEQYWIHFMEWEMKYPRERLKIIVNEGNGLATMPFRNLRLYGDYSIADFEDKALKQAYTDAAILHNKYPGVYGKDPGECDAARVMRANEFGLFLEYTIWRNTEINQQKYRDTTSPLEDFKAIMEFGMTMDDLQMRGIHLALDYIAATICEKVGIEILKEPSSKYRLHFDGELFVCWFNYYSMYLVNVCPDEDYLAKIIDEYRRGKDISIYAPRVDWRNT